MSGVNRRRRVRSWLGTGVPAALAVALLVPGPAAAQSDGSPSLGDFQHHVRRDGGGEDRSLVVTRSADGLLALGWQCTATGMRVLVALGWRWVGNQDDDILVHYRFPDDDGATETLWRLSGTGTVAWMRIGDIVAFTDGALAADSIQVTLSDPFDGESREARFGLGGLGSALGALECPRRRPPSPGR